MIFFTVGVALITTFSVSGLCSRVQVGPGGVYFVLSHVLGGRLGGVLGTLYVFGQVKEKINKIFNIRVLL